MSVIRRSDLKPKRQPAKASDLIADARRALPRQPKRTPEEQLRHDAAAALAARRRSRQESAT